ncbi:MAG: FAD:protein FMN transferase [Clostridia bacterium]|nr:FAD:protein FMN transferase [Clostridia bacterium]
MQLQHQAGYERFFEQDGVVYHHIFDVKTGYPAETDILSATVICKDAIDADCWSTILFTVGLEKAEEYIEEYMLDAVIMDNEGQVHTYGDIEFELNNN